MVEGLIPPDAAKTSGAVKIIPSVYKIYAELVGISALAVVVCFPFKSFVMYTI